MRETLAWARSLEDAGSLGELERLILQAGFGEYLGQLAHRTGFKRFERRKGRPQRLVQRIPKQGMIVDDQGMERRETRGSDLRAHRTQRQSRACRPYPGW